MPGGRPSDYTPAIADEICTRLANGESLPSIYGLFDKDGLLRYVGKANNPAQRLKGHARDSLKKNTPLYAWMRKRGIPEMRVLEANCLDWKEAERRIIREARERGDKLLNVADGGEQPFCSVEQRRKNAAALNKGLAQDEPARRFRNLKRMLSASIRQGYLSNETRERLRQAAATMPKQMGCFAGIPDRDEARV
jgi:hypothetical protein